MSSWKLNHTKRYQTRLKRYKRRHPREFSAIIKNLERFINAIELTGISPYKVKIGFVRGEPNGIIRISQKGGYGQGLSETRLYVYPDTAAKTLYLLCIGGKTGQPQDIQYCRKEVRRIRQQ